MAGGGVPLKMTSGLFQQICSLESWGSRFFQEKATSSLTFWNYLRRDELFPTRTISIPDQQGKLLPGQDPAPGRKGRAVKG